MDITQKIYVKLKKLLKRLQNLKVIKSFFLKINFCQTEDNFKVNLLGIDSSLKKCLKKIGTKHKRAEIRKVITKLVRKKNMKDVGVQSENEDTHTVEGYLNQLSQSTDENVILKPNICPAIDSDKFKHKKMKTINGKRRPKKFQKFFCTFCKKVFYNFLEWKIHNDEHSQTCSYKKEDWQKIVTSADKVEVNDTIQKTNKNKNGDNFLKIPQYSNLQNFNEIPSLQEDKDLKNPTIKKNSNHLKIAKKENRETFTCVCGKVFRFLKTLKKHESIKHSTNNISHSCGTCEKSFAEKGKLNRHMLSHKSNQFQCSQCFKLFSRSDALKRHVDIAHNLEKKWCCTFCQKKFSLKYNRDVHEENIHKNSNEQFQCEHCHGKYKNKLTLKSHLKTHLGKRITCSLCSKTFARKIHYKNHMKNKHVGISLYQNLLDSVTEKDVFSTMP